MSNPERQQNNDPSREPKEVKRSLAQSIKDFFRSIEPGKEERAEEYLQKRPEDVPADAKRTEPQKLRHQTQKARLDDLRQLLVQAASVGASDLVSQQAYSAAQELGNNGDIYQFQAKFYKKLATARIDDIHSLPFARYVAQSSEQIQTADQATSIKQKAELALEMFVGETGETTTAIPTLKKIVQGIAGSHDKDKVRSYFESDEFKALARDYGLEERHINELMAELNVTEPQEDKEAPNVTEDEIRRQMGVQKENILQSIDDKEQKARVDLFLLSLPPEKVRKLLKTIPEDVKYKGQRMFRQESPEELRDRLNEDSNKEGSLKLINEWIGEFTTQNGGKPLSPEQLSDIRQYILGVRNEYFVTFMRNFPPTIYDSANPYRNWINDMNDDLVITTLAMMSQNDFMFIEYYRGKIAEFLANPHHEDRLKDFIESAKNERMFSLNSHELFDYIMKEVTQATFYRMGENFRGNAYQLIDDNIKHMKTRKAIKDPTTLGGVNINFRYTQKEEVSEFGMELTREKVYNEASLAYATATFMSHTKELQEVSRHVGEFVKAVESGKTEDLISSAGKIDNKTMDFLGHASPIVRTAASAYIRLIRDKISFNSNQLPPDMFGNKDYIKNVLDKELEYHVKSVYDPNMTDEEREVYLKLGKALAFTSGEFQDILANALPPMTALIERAHMPQSLKDKLIKGEKLDLEELKLAAKILKPEYRDFPYRSLLIAMNPVRWLYAWIKDDDYGLFQLGFTPHKPGEEAIDWNKNIDITEAIRQSAFFGLDEESVKYFDGSYSIPFYKLTQWNQKISLEKRGGVRSITVDILRRHTSELFAGGLNKFDGMASVKKLMHYSPMLAYRFITDPPNKNLIDIDWGSGSKEKALEELFDFMHEYYPTFFMGLEQQHYFRRNELSFVQNIRQKVLDNLFADKEGRSSGYWQFLNSQEKNEDSRLMQGHDPTFLGPKGELQIAMSRDIVERMSSIIREAELFLQEERFEKQGGNTDVNVSLRRFFQESDPKSLHPKLYNRLVNKIINQRRGWHSLEASNEELFSIVKKFANEVFYGQNSLYTDSRYLGNATNGERVGINDLYQRYLKQGLLENPFNWAYLNQAEFNFQGTGTSMIGRNMKDFQTILDANSYFMNLTNTINDAISAPEKAAETIEKAFDGLDKKLWEVRGSHGFHLSSEIGWLMAAYTIYPFTPSRMKDLPGAGLIASRFLNSWASFFNKDDIFKTTAFDAVKRKKITDKWIHNPITKHVLIPYHENEKVKGKKQLEIKIPFTDRTIKLPITVRDAEKIFDGDHPQYTVDNIKKFAKVEQAWVGGKENLGIGYNTLMTVFLYGFIFMLVQAFREGIKAAESK